MDLSVVIVNWNTCDMLAQCLASVQSEKARLSQANIEVFVVDNASSDNSLQMIREQFPWVRLIANSQNVGFAQANNQAIQAACGEFVLLLNSDTYLHMDALGSLLRFMEHNPRAGGIGPHLLNADGTLQLSCHPMLTPEREFWRLSFLDQFWPRATYPMEKWDMNIPRPVDVIKGACLLLRHSALDQVGLLDNRYFMYTEEVDLCFRLLKAGWQLWYVPSSRVTHFGESSSRQVAEEMYVQLYRSKVQFYRKTGGEQRARAFKLLVTAAYLPRLMIASLQARRKTAWKPRANTYYRLLRELHQM